MLKEFKFNGYLYASHEGVQNKEALQTDIDTLLNSKFSNLEIEFQEIREFEVATKFNVILEVPSKEEIENDVLSTLEGFDVDNYDIVEM